MTLDAPTTTPISDMTYTVGDTAATMQFSDYVSSNPGSYTLGALSYSAELSDGSTLPTFINFDDSGANPTFTVYTWENANVATYTIRIKADEGGS